MKIALNWVTTGDPKTGLETFAARFIEALALIDRENKYLVTGDFWKDFGKRAERTIENLPDGFEHRLHHRPRNLANFLDWKAGLFFRERELFREGVDIYHGLDETLPPLKKVKSVITVHDIGFRVHPEWFPTSRSPLSWHHTLGRALCRCDMVIAISRYTKDEILRHYKGVDPEKIRVIYSGGAGKESRLIEDASLLSAFRGVRRLSERFVLSVAPSAPHKNVPRLVEAFGRMAGNHPGLGLVLVGRPGQDHQAVVATVKKMNITKRTLFFSDVTSSELTFFYNTAEIFLFPSLYEGFGLPVLEAMACGCPVITSAASLPEVAGTAALLVNPYRVEDIASTLQRLLNDKELREVLKRKGLEQIKRFSWEKNAQETLRVYREVGAR